MSITSLHPHWLPAHAGAAPYLPGDQVLVTGPDGLTRVAVVEDMTLTADGRYSLFASVVQPANAGSYKICTPVSADGRSETVRSA
ncbi:MAG: hypothetical protein ABIQ59_03060 [Nocardioidaceae bacterium]